jgi:hypothetical protein
LLQRITVSVKKKTTRRRSSQAKTTSTTNAARPSAAARSSAGAQVRGLITRFAPAHQRIATALRKWLRTHLPTAHEIVYEYRSWFVISYSPSERGYQGVLAIRGDADGIKLYFNQGKGLPDPERLLQGTANARWINVDSPSALKHAAVLRLVEHAIARNPVPFAPPSSERKGGAVILRSTTSSQPRRNRRGA